jgi:hypothetical protein
MTDLAGWISCRERAFVLSLYPPATKVRASDLSPLKWTFASSPHFSRGAVDNEAPEL